MASRRGIGAQLRRRPQLCWQHMSSAPPPPPPAPGGPPPPSSPPLPSSLPPSSVRLATRPCGSLAPHPTPAPPPPPPPPLLNSAPSSTSRGEDTHGRRWAPTLTYPHHSSQPSHLLRTGSIACLRAVRFAGHPAAARPSLGIWIPPHHIIPNCEQYLLRLLRPHLTTTANAYPDGPGKCFNHRDSLLFPIDTATSTL